VTDRDEVRDVIRRLNQSWLANPPEDIPRAMANLWHDDAAIVVLGVQEMARGREACMASYQDFVRQATVEESTLSEPSVDVWGSTAVATARWEMTYALDGERLSESGHETFVLTRTPDGWRIVWRALITTT
jgi:uncharacterized protein (TIGR02246 family)